jgi:hypothetical protein
VRQSQGPCSDAAAPAKLFVLVVIRVFHRDVVAGCSFVFILLSIYLPLRPATVAGAIF